MEMKRNMGAIIRKSVLEPNILIEESEVLLLLLLLLEFI